MTGYVGPRVDSQRLIEDLAPPNPPCFTGREQWVTYLLASHGASREAGILGPVDMRKTPPVFNLRFDYCEDCTAKHALRMQLAGRCKPHHLRKQTTTA